MPDSMGLGVWAELLDLEAIGQALPRLSAVGARIGLALASEQLGEPAVAALTRRARDAGVGVRAWLLLPRADGYWIGERNAEQFARALDELGAWCERPEGPAFDGVSVDLEPPFEYSEELRTIRKSRPDRWLTLLASHVDSQRFERARAVLGRAVERAHERGVTVHAVTYPLVLDQPDGESILEDALEIVVSGVDWDEVSFMVYQTAFAQQIGSWLGPALVHSYAKDAVRRFGPRAGIDLGVIGDAGLGLEPGDRYGSPAELAEDLAASLAAGIPLARTRVYGLAGMLEPGGIERWLSSTALAPRAPEGARAVDGLRSGARALTPALRALAIS